MKETRIRRLMRLMGLMPIYQTPNTSRPAKGHKTYPYLRRGVRVERPNQVWCSDITYLPMRRGFLYLVAIMGWHTRKVLSWRISNTLGADFCPSRQICFANRLPGNGQHLYREAVAHPDIRVRLHACLGDRIREDGGHPEMDDFLQSPAPSFSPRRQATSTGLLAQK